MMPVTRNLDLAELSLLMRALHQDVSALDDRLRALEQVVRELRAPKENGEAADLLVFTQPTTQPA